MRTCTHPLFHGARPLRAACSVLAATCALFAGTTWSRSGQPAVAQAAPQGQSASATRGLSEDQARRILPRAELSDLNDEQRAEFLEVAGDVFDYAGCRDTLAKCLGASVQDVVKFEP